MFLLGGIGALFGGISSQNPPCDDGTAGNPILCSDPRVYPTFSNYKPNG